MAIMTTSVSAIEILLKEALEKERIPFKEQYRIYEKGNSFHPKYVVDFFITFEQKRLIIECDGFSYHRSDTDVDSDIQRDMWLTSRGYIVLHFTAFQIKYEMQTVIRNIKHRAGMKKYPHSELAFRGRKVKKEPIVNCTPKEKLHEVSLYYNYTRVNDKLWLAYKFRDDTLGKCSEERTKVFCNVPENASDVLAIYTALKDLKKSVNLTVYCLSGWLSGYLNQVIAKREEEEPLIERIEDMLKRHNYLFKYTNKSRRPAYYEQPEQAQYIIWELRSRCMQMRHNQLKAQQENIADFLVTEKNERQTFEICEKRDL